jgi:hypothetical protein
VHVHAADPFRAGLQRLEQRLRGQIVQAHISLRRGEKPRLGRVELDALHRAGELAEGRLGRVLGELVDEDGLVGGWTLARAWARAHSKQ